MAKGLGIDKERVKVTGLKSGSVIVDYKIFDSGSNDLETVGNKLI